MSTAPLVRRDISIDATFDLETEEWDRYVVGGFLEASGAYLECDWRKEDRLVDAILGVEGCVWAHSGGTFDTKWLLDHVAARGITAQIVAAGSRIVIAKIGKTTICDSRALAPMTLAKLTSGLSVEKMKLEFPCSCGAECGGYCAIRRKMPAALWRRLRQYLYADCRSLFDALEGLRAFAAEHDLDLGATVGSSAWRNARRMLDLPPAELTAEEHKIVRAGYYGGRVQLPKPGKIAHGHEIDVASMYPWTLKTFALPAGARKVLVRRDARRAYTSGKAGIYHARVQVPEMHLPPLPYRYDRGTRTSYPHGLLQGAWTLPELNHAEERGALVVDVEKAIVWERSEHVFAPWVDRLFALRKAVGKKSALGTGFLKFYLNSLTGKLGSNPERLAFTLNPRKIYVCAACVPCRAAPGMDCGRCCELHCNGKCGASIQFSKFIFARAAWHLDDCAHVEWSAYLTAHGRIELNTQQVSIDGEGMDVIYSDTDSIYSELPRTRRLGSDLGEWESGGEFRRWRGVAPKVYSYEHVRASCQRGKDHGPCDECKDGGAGRTQRAKGIKLQGRRLRIGGVYAAAGIMGFRAGAKAGRLFQRNVNARKLMPQLGDRIPTNYGTRAPEVGELDP